MKKALCFLCGRNLANGYIKQTKLEGKVLLLHPGPYGFLWLLFLLYWILFLLLMIPPFSLGKRKKKGEILESHGDMINT